MNFDSERFISEIQPREAIWKMEGAAYKDLDLKRQQWRELVDIFGPENMTEDDKNKLEKELQKKWKNIRDCFVKAYREVRSGIPARRKTPYIFYNDLLFLKDSVKIFEPTWIIHSSDNSTDYVSGSPVHLQPPKRKKEEEEEYIQPELVYATNENVELNIAEDDGDKLFFLSLVGELKKVPEQMRLQTKAELLQVLAKAQAPYYIHSNTPLENPRPDQGPSQDYQTPSFTRSRSHRPPNDRWQTATWHQKRSPESDHSGDTQPDYNNLFVDSDS